LFVDPRIRIRIFDQFDRLDRLDQRDLRT